MDRAFDKLLMLYVEEELDGSQRLALTERLREAGALEQFARYVAIHAWLDWDRTNVTALQNDVSLAESEVASELPYLQSTRSPQSPILRSLQSIGSRLSRSSIAVTVLVATMVYGLFGILVWQMGQSSSEKYRADDGVRFADSSPDEWPEDKPVAVLTRSEYCVWERGSRTPTSGESLKRGPLRLVSGVVEVRFHDGAVVVVEGPATLELQSSARGLLRHGNLLAHVPRHSVGFTIETPQSTIIDLGTDFAVEVSSDEATQVEVLKGTIDVVATSSENQLHADRAVRLVAGDVRRISAGRVTVAESVVDGPPLAELPKESGSPPTRPPATRLVNVSLHKQVTASSSLSASGLPLTAFGAESVAFPAENVVDGQLDDGGSPDHFSYWLAENHTPAELTIDLNESQEMVEIWLQNTHNRQHDDRGTREYRLSTSVDGQDFVTAAEGELRDVVSKATIPIERIRLEKPVLARYVRFEAVTWYGYGAGLNEIAVFKRSSEPAPRKTP